ncbi:hypothetical protein O0L34_g14971 [Tuta absoluta]|nr:hypothetical protein O0L34_g14971 [Tuta absoluta]
MPQYLILCVIAFISVFDMITSMPSGGSVYEPLTIVSREEWDAKPPTEITKLQTPVPNVVIHHSYIPRACFSRDNCCTAMRSMQHMHQDVNGWADIGYNFAVGSDGLVYEGRGWNHLGAHSKGFNSQSIGICLIGDWTSELPPEVQMQAAKDLISEGLRLGWISPKYSLVGHRQVRDTECPGDALYERISEWKHFNDSIHMHL